MFLTQFFTQGATFAEVCKPGNFDSYNSLKLSVTNIEDLFLFLSVFKSFLEPNCRDNLVLCEKNLQFLFEGLSFFH